ncbi:hypothetical protein ACYZT2_26575 [Pseudomonas sp. MDT1-85]
MNMVFAIPALFAPALLTSMLGMPPQLSDPWLENAGMLLVGASADFKYDTRLEGNHNGGHLYGTQLSELDKRALIEFMKTL